jgi:hypothetical protein
MRKKNKFKIETVHFFGEEIMSNHKHSIWPGLILIIIGALLLVHKLTPYSFGWYEIYPLILIALGALIFVSVIGKRDKGAVFFGTIFFLLGLFFFLRNYDIIPYYYMREVWPTFLIILGLAFGSIFITKPSDWGVLIPAGIFLFLGVVFLLRKLHVIYWDIGDIIADYWPVILIIIGGGIILGALKRSSCCTETNT